MGARGPGAKPIVRPKSTKIKRRSKKADRVSILCKWLETLPVTSGPLAGTKFKLRPWQKAFIKAVYGPKNAAGRRLVRQALLTMARKNGKTGLAAGLALAHLCGPEAEQRGQVFSAAADRKQASLIFNEMEAIIFEVPELSNRCNVRRFTKDIEDSITGSKYTALSSDAALAHGLNPSFVVYDELAQAPDRRLFDALVTATGGRAEPLILVISTQSDQDSHVLSELIDYSTKINSGEVIDPGFVGKVYTVPLDANIWDEKVWYLANPALNDFRSLDEMRSFAARAKRLPALEASFRSFYLNQRVAGVTGLIPRHDWNCCSGTVELETLHSAKCWGGLDLSSVRDLTAFVLWFPESGAVLAWHWLPEEGLLDREIAEGLPWTLWQRQGWLRTTPGRTVDRRFVAAELAEIVQPFDLLGLAYDRWGMNELKRVLQEDGITLPLHEFGQGYQSMGPAVSALERELVEHRLKHNNNPILNLAAANVHAMRDPTGARKPIKKQEIDRIDGIVALIMALGLAAKTPKPIEIDFSRNLVLSA